MLVSETVPYLTTFCRYLVKSHIKLKTEEVLSKWEVLPIGSGPRPTVGNFCKIVYVDLERPDVIDDLYENIGKRTGQINEFDTDLPIYLVTRYLLVCSK